jgi:hypothetical protein
MRIIVILGEKTAKKTHVMLELPDKKMIEVKELLKTLKLPDALAKIATMGETIKKLTEEELVHTASDLILTDRSIYWNLL